MNEPSRLSDSGVTDLLRRRSARPAPHGLASAILGSLASERARHPARATGRSAKRPLMLLAAAALLLAGGALAAGSGALRLWSVTPPEPAPSLGLVDFPNLTTTFVSPRNGFSVKHPDRVALTPAEQLWGFSKQVDDGFDVVETGLAAVFKGASTELAWIPNGVSVDAQVDAYMSDDYVLPGGCGVPRGQQAEITIDGQSGRISECPNRIEATVVAGGRLYLFTLLAGRSDARAVFDAFAATIDLTPETAVDYPGLTSTFVSPTNDYSFMYIDRGGLDPAKALWDPVNQPPIASDDSMAPSRRTKPNSMSWRQAWAPSSRARRRRSRMGSRSMDGSTPPSSSTCRAAACSSQPTGGDHHRRAVGQDLGVCEPDRRNRRRRRATLSLHPAARQPS